MKKIKKFLICLFLCTSYLHAEIPIIAFCGVSAHESTADRFKEFKEAGFDISIENYGDLNVAALRKILDEAYKEKIRLIINSSLLDSDLTKIVSNLKDHPALFAFYLADEPAPKDFKALKKKYQAIRKIDSVKTCYMNLLPNYGAESMKYHKIEPYNLYLLLATSIDLPQLSFDHYPITIEGIRPTWYQNLEDIRKESLRTLKPFWAFVLCTPHNEYPTPTLASLRLQIYSNLAYGAQAIQYFTYWTPKPYGQYNFHDGPIGLDGRRTATYNLVKSMNTELRQLLPLFDGATIKSVHHLIQIPEGTTKQTQMPTNIKSLKVTGKTGAILSTMYNKNHEYLLIVNKDYQNSLLLNIRTTKDVVILDKHLQPFSPRSSYNIAPGDMLIFRLK